MRPKRNEIFGKFLRNLIGLDWAFTGDEKTLYIVRFNLSRNLLNVDSKYLTIPFTPLSTYQQLHFVHAINGINKTTFINTDISSVKIVVSILLAVLEYV